jgi:hypothetical protein
VLTDLKEMNMRKVKINSALENMGCTGSLSVVDAESGEVICAITARGGQRQRDLTNAYDRHRVIMEGSMSTLTITGYDVVGDVQATIDSIKKNLPQCFHDSRFARPYTFRADDAWPVFDFFRTLTDHGGWYGNTPKPLVKKIKSAWAKGFDLGI